MSMLKKLNILVLMMIFIVPAVMGWYETNNYYTFNNAPNGYLNDSGVRGAESDFYGKSFVYNTTSVSPALNQSIIRTDSFYTPAISNSSDIKTIDFWYRRTTPDHIQNSKLFKIGASGGDTSNELFMYYPSPAGNIERIYLVFYQNGSGNAGVPMDSASGNTVNVWQHFVFVFANGNIEAYMNGSLRQNVSGWKLPNNWNISLGWTGESMPQEFDNFATFPYAYTPQNVTASYNNGQGMTFTPSEGPEGLKINNVTFDNGTGYAYGDTMNQFSNLFHFYVNATNNGLPIDASTTCNYSVSNLSHQYNYRGGNRSLTNTDSHELFTDHFIENNIVDIVLFRVCHEGPTSKDVEVYMESPTAGSNVTPQYSIDSSIIPSCSAGFHEDIYQTTDFITDANVNISIQCPLCVGINSLRIIKLDRPINALLVREHGYFTDDLTYNESSLLFQDAHEDAVYPMETYHSFYTAGELEINFTCNDSDIYQYNVTVLPLLPVANLDEITSDLTTYDFTVNETQIESGSNYTILGGCSESIITTKQLNLTFYNDTFIASTNSEILNVDNTDITEDGLYKAIMFCKSNGNSSTLVRTFWVNDTIDPRIVWVAPNNLNTTTTELNQSFTTDISMIDTNLFAFNCTVLNPNNQVKQVYSLTDINVSRYSLQESFTPDMTGKWSINCTVADDHTKKTIPDYDFEYQNDRKIVYKFNHVNAKKERRSYNISIDYEGTYPIKDIQTYKQVDRYKFKYKFNLGADKNSDEVRHKWRVTCNNIVYRTSSNYPAHFICNNAHWLDFSSQDMISYTVDKINNNVYEIDARMKGRENILFKSLGGLNEITESRTFQVTPPIPTGNVTIDLFECPDSIPGQMSLFTILAFLVVFYILGLAKAPILSFFSALGIVFMSTIYYTCQSFGGIFMAIVGLMMIIVAIFRGISYIPGGHS